MKKKQKNEIYEDLGFTSGSGNVYADLGFNNPEEMLAKASLAMLIYNIIKDRGISQEKAAELMGIDQPKVSKIIRGLLKGFSIERLMKFIVRLGYDVEISPKVHNKKSTNPSIYVREPQKRLHV